MRSVTILIFGLLSPFLFAQETINSSEFQDYMDKKVRYCDKVSGTFISSGNKKIMLLNLGKDYPNQNLTVAIFEENWAKFDYKPDEFLKEKTICVTGKLITYKEKPEIIVSNPKQIEIQ